MIDLDSKKVICVMSEGYVAGEFEAKVVGSVHNPQLRAPAYELLRLSDFDGINSSFVVSMPYDESGIVDPAAYIPVHFYRSLPEYAKADRPGAFVCAIGHLQIVEN